MHLLSFHRRIVSAGLLLMVIDWIFENCYSTVRTYINYATIVFAAYSGNSVFEKWLT